MDNLEKISMEENLFEDSFEIILKKYEELSEKIEKRLNEIKSKKSKK